MKINKIAASLGLCVGMLAASNAFAARSTDFEVFFFDEAGNMVGESYTPCFGPTQNFGVQEGRRVEGFLTPCSRATYSFYCTAQREQKFDPANPQSFYWENMADTINRCLNTAAIPML